METFTQEMLDALSVFQRELGEVEYKYYAIPVRWRSGKRGQSGTHYRPVTDIDRYLCSREEYENGKEQSKSFATQAFMGKFRGDYTDFQRRIKRAGWREKLIEYLKAEQENN